MQSFLVFSTLLAFTGTFSLAHLPLITLINHSGSIFGKIASSKTPPPQENQLKCSRPCQRLPNMVKLQPLLTRYGVNKNIVSLIEASTMNSYGEIDIGRCAGSCRAVEAQNIRVSTVPSSSLCIAYKL